MQIKCIKKYSPSYNKCILKMGKFHCNDCAKSVSNLLKVLTSQNVQLGITYPELFLAIDIS